MSQEPWTLFCPRKGFTPTPSRPILPVAMARLAMAITVVEPWLCSVTARGARFPFYYNVLSLDRDLLSVSGNQRSTVAAQNHGELLGLADQSIDQRCQGIALRNDQTDGVGHFGLDDGNG